VRLRLSINWSGSCTSVPSKRSAPVLLVLLVALVVGGGLTIYLLRRPHLPQQGSPQYEEVTRAFYRGLAALDVGLLDNARQDFTRATQTVPEEPAAWANLGLSSIRLGELDAAADQIARAQALAPANPDIALLAGRAEIARGQLERGLEHLKRAAQLDPRGLPARYAVAEEIQRGELTARSRLEAQALYDELLTLAPNNLVILIERARLAAADDLPLAREMTRRLETLAGGWPGPARQQLDQVKTALAASRGDDAVRDLTRLRNVLARVPAYRESLSAVRTAPELIAEPFRRFLALKNPSATSDPPDPATTFRQEPAGNETGLTAVTIAAMAAAAPVSIVPRAAVPIDWNRDFRIDLVEADASGLRVFEQDTAGQFVDVTARTAAGSPFTCGCSAAWAADLEMDGDVDLVVGLIDGPTAVLRNNGDGSWQPLQTFAAIRRARSFAWGDIDGDADPDGVFVDATGAVHVLLNRQAGQFAAIVAPGFSRTAAAPDIRALAAITADVNADGLLDVVGLTADGQVTASTWQSGRWSSRTLATWGGFDASAGPGAYRLFVADFDNNGALDLLVSGSRESRVWLADERLQFAPLTASIPAPVFGAGDLNADGRMDLAGVVEGRPVRFRNSGQKAYHWKAIRARAQDTAGDQRVNSFGVGGDVEVRAGLLVQKQILAGLPTHFGLGSHTAIDVARIVWPNGVPQAEFDVGVDDAIVAEQRLKGSCPWVFTWDGERFVFVTDFLWRSPLGLRINAQDTAGTTQTEDWIRIRGDQLKARDGFYDVRITAELWETHFFDHVSLLTVDHQADVETFVDERFSSAREQDKAVRTVRGLRPVVGARDDQGNDVSRYVAAVDGQYLATFARGEYQGIAREHAVEFDLPGMSSRDRRVLIAQGWVYPTDSSINVAIGQRRVGQPRGLSLEAKDSSGSWRTIEADLGFPAGKNKTMVIDLAGAGDARKLRLRTSLEVYWDALRVGNLVDVPVTSHRLALARADLRYRGFSVTTSPRGQAPETADYDRLANTTPRWRDLEGYYTRFGDVNELLATVDDRYVIMNAGDEMQLRFPAGGAVPQGWRRDFVLIGDGWEKDGDYNTEYSSTVTPLPTHAPSEYVAASRRGRPSSPPSLEEDPVYRRHRDDWDAFHTRYVTPERFLRGLR
jgi:tetratricopeptide (TPR) repeat protein